MSNDKDAYHKTIENLEALKSLYEENGEIARTFLEWRHKVMTRFFVTAAAFLIAASWLYTKDSSTKTLVFLPLLAISGLSTLAYVMEAANDRYLRLCLSVGAQLEREMTHVGGIYATSMEEVSSPRTPHYTTIFQVFYAIVGTVLLISAIYLAVWSPCCAVR